MRVKKKSPAERCIRKQIPIRINFSGNSKTFIFQQGKIRRAEPRTPGTAELWSPYPASKGLASPQAPSDPCEPPSALGFPPRSMSLHHPQCCTDGIDGLCSTPCCWAASPILPKNQAASQPSSIPGVAPDFGKNFPVCLPNNIMAKEMLSTSISSPGSGHRLTMDRARGPAGA